MAFINNNNNKIIIMEWKQARICENTQASRPQIEGNNEFCISA